MPAKMTQIEFEKRVKEYTNNAIDVIGIYINKRTPVAVKCKKCGYEWNISPASLCPSATREYHFKGCSECKYEYVNCAYCNKEIKRLKSHLNTISGYVYCSRECGNRHKAQLAKRNDSSSYRRNAFEYYDHKCAICDWNEEVSLLEVHHIDEDRTNNALNNLVILCPICHKKLTMHLYSLTENNKLIKID